jgi:hypothetical protein
VYEKPAFYQKKQESAASHGWSFFDWRNLAIEPVLLLRQGPPRGFHAPISLVRRFVGRSLSELGAILRILPEVIRLFHGVLLCE